MAIQTFQYANFLGGIVRLEYDINDANWRIVRFRCVNDSDEPARMRIYKAGQLILEGRAAPYKTTTWGVGNICLGWQPDYLDTDTGLMESGGIDMGDYVFQAQWPAEA